MARLQLPIGSLPVWQTLNDVAFVDVRLTSIAGKGYGLVATRSLQTAEQQPPPLDQHALVTVPRGLVLHAEAVEEYARQDRNFRLLLDAAGHQSARGDILLFLLVQVVLGLKKKAGMALPNPWTEYVKFLPDDVPLPTLWTDAERLLLQGTSLETAVAAKLVALENEFDALRDASSDIPFWQAAFWDDPETGPQRHHWFLVDAWYRSRCLELPRSGIAAMVPCLDMVNHSAAPNAYYEEKDAAGDGDVVLLLRPQQRLAASDEITISYSGESGESGTRKSASEMLFSYGFVDPASARSSLVLPFRPLPDDPLAKAKLHVFGSLAPRLEVRREADDDENAFSWTCPFAHLACLNEEDGLDFRLRQETDGSTQLRVFWQDVDVTDRARDFAILTQAHPLTGVFQLRVATVLQELLEAHLERMQAAAAAALPGDGDDDNDNVRSEVAQQAARLRDIESRVLSGAIAALESQRSALLMDASVVAYLGSRDVSESELVVNEAANEETADDAMNKDADDDFS